MDYMFGGCSGLTSLDVSGFKTDNVTTMCNIFSGCAGVTSIYAGDGWSTANVHGQSIFPYCLKLVGGAGTKYDANHTDITYAHIDEGESNPGYFTAKSGGTGISTLKAAADKDVWYDLNGYKLQGEPAIKGVYMKNGKKYVKK
jgi:surface protein